MHMDEPLVIFRRFFQSVEFCAAMAMHLCSDQKSLRCIWFIKNWRIGMNENWSRPKGDELEENKAAIRQMRVIAWLFVAIGIGGLCLWAGLYIGSKVFGG